LLTGAVPSLVYGGYTGLMLGTTFFGPGTGDLLGTRILTGVGMVVGLVLTLFVYLGIGALLGRLVGAALHRHAPRPDGESVPVPADRR
jgi:hypothetical protein